MALVSILKYDGGQSFHNPAADFLRMAELHTPAVKSDDGTACLTLSDSSGNVAVAGDLTVTGNDIKGSGGTALTLDGSNNVTAAADLTVTGNLTVNGTTTTVDTTNLNIKDPLIQLGSNNSADTLDLGFVAKYNDGSDNWCGLFRDATDGVFKLFKETTEDLSSVTAINTGAGGYDHANLQVGALTADDASTLASGTTIGNLTLADGSITDSSGTISFGNDNLDIDGTVTVGVDDTGYDVQFFGDTTGAYMLWDTSADDLMLAGAAGLNINAGTASINSAGAIVGTSINIGGVTATDILDEDNMASNSATALASQQSIKAYVDAQVGAGDLDFTADSGGAHDIELDTDTMTFTGGTGVNTVAGATTLTIHFRPDDDELVYFGTGSDVSFEFDNNGTKDLRSVGANGADATGDQKGRGYIWTGGTGAQVTTVSEASGDGGGFSVTCGVGGAGHDGHATRTSGAGGAVAFTAGAGGVGDSDGVSIHQDGGVGGSITITAGDGGAGDANAASAGGNGGSITFVIGEGGANGGAGSAGNPGTMVIQTASGSNLSIDLTGQATAYSIKDNTATAFSVSQSSNNYIVCDTTNNAERVNIGKHLMLDKDTGWGSNDWTEHGTDTPDTAGQIVYILNDAGSPKLSMADANTDSSYKVFGVWLASGEAIHEGGCNMLLERKNFTGDAIAAGDPLYLSAVTTGSKGRVTNTAPSGGDYIAPVGWAMAAYSADNSTGDATVAAWFKPGTVIETV